MAREGAEADEEPVEDLLKPGHLSRLLEEELAAEVEALSVGDVSGGVEQLLGRLRSHRDGCEPQQLQVGEPPDCSERCSNPQEQLVFPTPSRLESLMQTCRTRMITVTVKYTIRTSRG